MRGWVPWTLFLLVAGLLPLAGRSTAALPGENGKIAWASARDGNFEIYSAAPDRSGLARLTSGPAADIDPAWSADGTRIAFTSNRSGSDDIYVMAANGSGQTRLTTDPKSDVNPTWSPGGRNLAFASSRDGDAEIFVTNDDGSGQNQLTSNDAPDAVPAWSPDGSQIAFTSARDGNWEIYVMNVDGKNQTRLTMSPGSDVSPSWSPDGKQIAFASDRDGNYEIYVMNADGTSQRRLTSNLEIDLDPAWSPDGKQIAFTSNRDGNYEIYVMNADGSGQTRFTAAQGEDTTPDWQPVPTVPPPPTAVSTAVFAPRWHESAFRGSLVVAGEVPGRARIQLVLSSGNATRFTTSLVLETGVFRRTLKLPSALLPGRYVLRVTAPGSPTDFTPQVISLVLRAPPEGVVRRAWASEAVGGPSLERFPSTTTRVFAHFQLAALPRPGRVLTATWYGPGFAGEPRRKPASALVISYVNTTNGVPLPTGGWTCVLRAGQTVVKRVTFRIG